MVSIYYLIFLLPLLAFPLEYVIGRYKIKYSGLSFVGSIELLVYTGSIVILIVFVLMLTGGKDVEE